MNSTFSRFCIHRAESPIVAASGCPSTSFSPAPSAAVSRFRASKILRLGLARFLTAPPPFRRPPCAAAQDRIEPQHKPSQKRAHEPEAQSIHPTRVVPIVGTDSQADGAIGDLLHPKTETLLRVGRPFSNASDIRSVVNPVRRVVPCNHLWGTVLAAATANVAKFLHPEPFRLVVSQGQDR